MKSSPFFCFLSMCFLLSTASLAQVKTYIGHDNVFPDQSGKVIAFKATYSSASDTIYFVDVATGAITDRMADGSFGLEFKLMKAKVLDRDKFNAKDITCFHAFDGDENYEWYFVRLKGDSTLAKAQLPKVDIHGDPRVFYRKNPRTVLLATRLEWRMELYNMLDTTAGGFAKLLYSHEDKKSGYTELFDNHLRNVVISPNGRYAFALPNGVMIDLVKGKSIWNYNLKGKGDSRVVFSEDGMRVAIEQENRSVTVRDVQKGKELYRIPSPPTFPGELKVEHSRPLSDMQSCFVFYKDFKSGFAKVLLLKADGSYKEVL